MPQLVVWCGIFMMMLICFPRRRSFNLGRIILLSIVSDPCLQLTARTCKTGSLITLCQGIKVGHQQKVGSVGLNYRTGLSTIRALLKTGSKILRNGTRPNTDLLLMPYVLLYSSLLNKTRVNNSIRLHFCLMLLIAPRMITWKIGVSTIAPWILTGSCILQA